MKISATHIPWHMSWKGLLGTKTPQAIHFETRFGIHTFGMRYPIDVVILDSNLHVRKIKTFLKPNNIFVWNPLYFHVVELPAGTIAKKHIIIGEKLEII